MSERRQLEAAIEAILFVSGEPVARDALLATFDEREREDAAEALETVVERYRESPERGFLIDEVAGGLRLVTRPDLHGYLRRFFEVTGASKLSMAAIETLAIVAYRQPVTAPEIQELRGVGSSGVLKTLLERRLIRIAGRKEVVGRPFLYATTREFLMHFGLRALDELPPLEQFEELYGGELEAAAVEPDHEEEVLRQAAELEEREDDAAAAAEKADDEAAEDAETGGLAGPILDELAPAELAPPEMELAEITIEPAPADEVESSTAETVEAETVTAEAVEVEAR